MPAPAIGVSRRPPSPAGIEWNHPLAAKLLAFVVRCEGTTGGYSGTVFTSGAAVVSDGLSSVVPANGFTYAADPAAAGTGAAGCFDMGRYIGSSSQCNLGLHASGTNLPLPWMRQDSFNSSGGTYSPQRPGNNMAWVYTGSGNTIVYEEGTERATVASNYTSLTRMQSPSPSLLEVPIGMRSMTGRYGAVWLRPLSASEVAQFHSNPFQLLRY